MDCIKKIELDLGGKKVVLTPKQAKKLRESLNELFGREVVKEIHHHDHYKWWWDYTPLQQYPPYFTYTTYGSPTLCSDSDSIVSSDCFESTTGTLCLTA